MAHLQEIDYSTTFTNNTDVDNQSTLGSAPADTINEIMQKLMKLRAAAITRHVAKTTGTYTAVKTDHDQFWRSSGGAVTINLTAAATLGDGWCLWLRAGQSSPITIDPNGAETIDTFATRIIPEFHIALLICTGTTFFFEIYSPLLTAFNVWTGFMTGLTLTNNAGDATNDIDIAAGAARDGTDVFTMVTTALTKQLDVAWAVGTNAGGLDTGAVGNSIYSIWLIRRSDTGVVDVLFSLSATAPTMPANYDQKVRIGSFCRSGGVNTHPRSFSEKEATPWLAYTPTISAGFGTTSNVAFFSRRVGDELQIEGKFTIGTVAASGATVSIGYNGGNGNVIFSTARYATGNFKVGDAADQTKGALNTILFSGSTVGFGLASADWQTVSNGNIIATTTNQFTLRCSLKINGW